MSQMLTVNQIAERFGVSSMAVRLWIKDGLPVKYEKVIGIKTRMIIDPENVIEYQKRKERR